MAHSRVSVYNKNLVLPIFDKNMQIEERTLNIIVNNFNENIEIKIRDPTEYYFNYTQVIDLADFEIMRNSQSLDINFEEFKYNLLDMLQQIQKKEMFLKCVICNDVCTLVFYGKSKIKSIVYLTIDLHTTNQKELFNELISHLQEVQDSNIKLKKQLSGMRNVIAERDTQIQQANMLQIQLQDQIKKNLKRIDDLLNIKFKKCEEMLTNRINILNERFIKSLRRVEILKKEALIKSDSSTRLLRNMEKLRLETIENTALINRLKQEINCLENTENSQKRHIIEIKKIVSDKEQENLELEKKNEELRTDLEKATIIITQKKATVDELSRDLVQANQMLVNFNNHYDTKAKQVEDLQSSLESSERIINDQKSKQNELLREFEEYRRIFNKENQEAVQHELFTVKNKNEELESQLRKVNKINVLLTEKINNQNTFNRNPCN